MVATAATHCSPAASSVRAALAEMRADHVEQFEARIRRWMVDRGRAGSVSQRGKMRAIAANRFRGLKTSLR